MGRWTRMCCAVAGAAGLVLGCQTPLQRVGVNVAPHPVFVIVDGDLVFESPDELRLRSDQHHTLFFKSAGYRSELVVLRSHRIEGGWRLQPEDVELQLRELIPVGRKLTIEVPEAD